MVLAAALLFAGCGLGSFDVTETVAPQTVPGTSAGAPPGQSAFETVMSVPSSDLPRGSSLVNSVTLSSAKFDIMSPQGGTFDFVQSVKLSIMSPTNTTLPETQIATGQSTPGSSTLELQPTGGVDLLPYVRANAVVHATGTGSPPTDTTVFNGSVVLTVHLF
jgi:hypothetical protein